jgi:hypothetical protein
MGIIRVFIVLLILCLPAKVWAQFSLESLIEKYNAHQNLYPVHKAHLILNKNKAIIGDTIFFKTYVMASDLTPLAGEQLVEVHLVDSEGNSKASVKFMAKYGTATNQIVIPAGLEAGSYILTAHTNWMKNFGQEAIFRKHITIVNDTKFNAVPDLAVKVAAEGGKLIAGIDNKIAVVSPFTDSNFLLLNDEKDTLQTIRTDNMGRGSLILTPALGTGYTIKFIGHDDVHKLPAVVSEGLSVQLTPGIGNAPIRIKLAALKGSNIAKKPVFVVVSSKGRIYGGASVTQANKDFVILQIPTVGLPDGYYQVSFLNEEGNLLASRDFYRVDTDGITTQLTLPKSTYETREKVDFNVLLENEEHNQLQGNYVMSVKSTRLFGGGHSNHFQDELELAHLGNPTIDRSKPNWLYSLDSYMIARTVAMDWSTLLASEIAKMKYSNSNVIARRGTIFYKADKRPVEENARMVFYLQRELTSYVTFVGNNGSFSVEMAVPEYDDELLYFVKAGESETSEVTIEWEEDNFRLPSAPIMVAGKEKDDYATSAKMIAEIESSYGFFVNESEIKSIKGDSSTKMLQTLKDRADLGYNIQDYIKFATMEELIREIIKALSTSKKSDQFLVRVAFPVAPPSDNDPLYIIDGIASKNTDFFMKLDPSDLVSLRIIRDRRLLAFFGLIGRNGIVIVDTKTGNVRELLTDMSKVLKGLNPAKSFVNKSYSDGSNSSYYPDFRTVLYWNANATTDTETNTFYCSDDIGEFTIIVKGFTASGMPFSIDKPIKVVLEAGVK